MLSKNIKKIRHAWMLIKFWPCSVLLLLSGRRGSEIKLLQVFQPSLSVLTPEATLDAADHFICVCVPHTQRPQFPGWMWLWVHGQFLNVANKCLVRTWHQAILQFSSRDQGGTNSYFDLGVKHKGEAYHDPSHCIMLAVFRALSGLTNLSYMYIYMYKLLVYTLFGGKPRVSHGIQR